jgi:hypothetical protein
VFGFFKLPLGPFGCDERGGTRKLSPAPMASLEVDQTRVSFTPPGAYLETHGALTDDGGVSGGGFHHR